MVWCLSAFFSGSWHYHLLEKELLNLFFFKDKLCSVDRFLVYWFCFVVFFFFKTCMPPFMLAVVNHLPTYLVLFLPGSYRQRSAECCLSSLHGLLPISILQALCSATFGKNRPCKINQRGPRASSQPGTPALFPQRLLASIVSSCGQSLLILRVWNA